MTPWWRKPSLPLTTRPIVTRGKRRSRPRLELLEDRLVPAAIVFANDDWHFFADNDADNALSVGDTVRNDNDIANPATISALYGIDGFGTVTTGDEPGALVGSETLQDAVANTDVLGRLNILTGDYAGSLDVNKSITVAPGGSPGQVHITGNLVFSIVGATLDVEVDGLAAGTQYDQLVVDGTVDLNGADNVNNKVTLSVTSAAAFDALDAFDIITSGSGDVEGRFFNGPSIVSGGTANTFIVVYNPGSDDVVRLVCASGAAPSMTYVDDDFGTVIGDLILDADPVAAGAQPAYFGINAFDSIQDAVDAVADGGTVIVNSHGPNAAPTGVYAESVTIAKALTLDGNAISGLATDVVIDPLLGNAITVAGAAADNVTIRDLRVTGATADGINAASVDDLTLTNIRADSNGDDGIELNTITGLGSLADIVASDNFDDGLVGAALNTAGTVTIVDSIFNDNGTIGLTGDGIDLSNVGDVATTNVTANGNDPGIVISGALSWADIGGNFSLNLGHGISLTDIAGVVSLNGTTANDNGGNGLNAVDGGDAGTLAIGSLTVLGSTFSDTALGNVQQVGVSVADIGGAVLFDDAAVTPNTVEGNAAGGVALGGVAGAVTFTSNNNASYSDNDGDGIRVVSLTGILTVSGVTVDDNGEDGLDVGDGGTTATISGSFSGNTGNGLNLNSAGGAASFTGAVSLTDVVASGNSLTGVQAINLNGTTTITGGTFDDNGEDGLNLDGTGAGTALTFVATLANTTDQNGDDGLFAQEFDSVTIDQWSFSQNGAATTTGEGFQGVNLAGASVITTSQFVGNDRGIAFDGGSLTVTDSSIDTNDGDGIRIVSLTGILTVSGVTVDDNGEDGLDVGDGGTTATISGSFSGNTGNGLNLNSAGGAASFTGAVSLTDVVASGNSLTGVQAINLNGTTTITGGTFDDNGEDGLNLDGTGAGTALTFVATLANTTDQNGDDGLFAQEFDSVTIDQWSFSQNGTATTSGEGFQGINLAGASVITTSQFVGNDRGIAFSGGSLTVTGSAITDNDSVGSGAGISVSAGDLTLDGGTLVNENEADVSGGGIAFTSPGTLTITGPLTDVLDNEAALHGGGIFIDNGTLILQTDVAVMGNTATGGSGGGIFIGGGALHRITEGIVRNHADAGSGGGIHVDAAFASTLTITDTLIGCLIAADGNTANVGGGLHVAAGTVDLVASTVSHNFSATNGGGISVLAGAVTGVNVTISTNRANLDGGGIHVAGGSVTLNHATVARNSADDDGNGSGNGGGALNVAGTLEAVNSIFAENNFQDPTPPAGANLAGGFTNNGFNLLVDTNALLSALGFHGAAPGLTPTHALLPGSAALDQIPAPTLATDQRGVARPVNVQNDIGAFESAGFTVTHVTPASPPAAKYRALVGNDFLAPNTNTPLAFMVVVKAVDNAEPIFGGRIFFSATVNGGSTGTPNTPSADITSANFVVDVVNGDFASAGTMVEANLVETPLGADYDLVASAGGNNRATWDMYNQRVTTLVYDANPDEATRSGSAIDFNPGFGTDFNVAVTMRDREGQLVAISDYVNALGVPKVFTLNIQAIGGPGQFMLGGPALAGGLVTDHVDLGVATFANLKIYTSSWTQQYQIEASFVNPGDAPALAVKQQTSQFRILPYAFFLAGGTQFVDIRQAAPVPIVVASNRGRIRIVINPRRANRTGVVNQVVVRAFDVFAEGATGTVPDPARLRLATSYDGPMDLVIVGNRTWALSNPTPPGSSVRDFLDPLTKRVVRTIATGGQATVRGISPSSSAGFFRIQVALLGRNLQPGNLNVSIPNSPFVAANVFNVTPNDVLPHVRQFFRVALTRQRRK